MHDKHIEGLFASDIYRRIEEVIKVDQADEQIIYDEITEYVVTDAIRHYYAEIFERYRETPNKPHEGIGVWVSGFFGSGKSSFAKMLGLALSNRAVLGQEASELFGERTRDARIQVLLKNIAEHIPTEAVIFDVSTDRGIRSGNQTITEIMYRLFLQRLGYARDLDLSELEITLEGEGRLDQFKETYAEIFDKDWDVQKGKVAIAVQQASRVMHVLKPDTYTTVDSWREAALRRADITPGRLAERCKELMGRRRPGQSLVFVIDEVGQFVSRDVQKMLDLQAVVQSLGRVGRGTFWLVVTSQEKLTELVGGLDDRRVELARLMDRFPLQVHLEPADISEVTSKRVLSKNAEAEKTLRSLYNDNKGRLIDTTRLSADIRLPELTTERFIDLYPLLPYHIDLIINVVSGLRTQGGASKHVGGANRTIIKLAQQLLIHEAVKLAQAHVGTLARIDQIYDLVAGNIASEIRGKIDAIEREVDHPLAQPVAKAICLLQYVKSIHRTAENIAAALHPAVDAGSRLAEVKEALEALIDAKKVRLGDDGYRIPSPVEDDWERQRGSLSPRPGDVSRTHQEVVDGLWKPQPSYSFLDTRLFKAGLYFNGRLVTDADIPFHLTLAEAGADYDERVAEMRARSQVETKSIFWVVALDEAIDRETVEVFRSKEILSRKERGARTKDETALVSEEKIRLRRHQDELRRLLKKALLTGTVFFRGNERSPDETAVDVNRTAGNLLAQALPEVFDRFHEAAARVKKKDLEALTTQENLRGLPPVFTELHLIRDEKGMPVFNVESGPLAEVLARVENRTSYGEVANGRYLAGEFAKEPFGWDFDVVRLFVVALLRAGKLEATSKGQIIESALSVDARNTFGNNNLFRQASFRPKVGLKFENLADASEHFRDVFGHEIAELEQGVVAQAIRAEVNRHEEDLQAVHTTLLRHDLPGAPILQEAADQMRAIRNGNAEHAILTFNGAYRELKEAIKRASELSAALTETQLHNLNRARRVLGPTWSFLEQEDNLEESCRTHAETLKDLMERETFFRELPAIDQHTKALEDEYQRRYDQATQARVEAYAQALDTLHGTPGSEQLNEEQQARVSAPLVRCAEVPSSTSVPIPQLRADLDACSGRLNAAIEEMLGMVEGNRLVRVNAATYFAGGIDTEEQLDAALDGLREECLQQIGAGKKVLVQ